MLFNLIPGSSLATIFFPRQDKLTQYINIYFCKRYVLLLHVSSLNPGVQMGTTSIRQGENPTMD